MGEMLKEMARETFRLFALSVVWIGGGFLFVVLCGYGLASVGWLFGEIGALIGAGIGIASAIFTVIIVFAKWEAMR